MSIQTRVPSVTILAPSTPSPSVTLMWTETPFSVLLASSGYTSTAPGPIASSFTAETFALKQGLDWCTNHLMTCKFQSFFFLTDFQSARSILSAPSYLLPESLWNVWSLASSLSNNTTLNFLWVPGHADLPGNEKADLLAKAGASLPTDAIPCPLPPVIAKIGYLHSPVPQLETSHLPLLSKLPSPRSLFGGTAPFSPYSQ